MNAQCIMVCSGKGGTGKSTVSVLLGACLARLGRKTLLVELDSGAQRGHYRRRLWPHRLRH